MFHKRIKPNAFLKPSYFTVHQRRNRGWFQDVPMAPPDVIFGLVDAYKKDPNPNKVNLSVGAYRDDDNKPFVLSSVRQAEKIVCGKNLDKEYSSIVGPAEFNELSANFAFGKNCEYIKSGNYFTYQVLSGNGGLCIITQFLKFFYPGRKVVYMSKPTWPNHANIFNWLGVKIAHYRYYNKEEVSLDFESMIEDINEIPKKSIILLHASAHNPTGFDPTKEQWEEIAAVVKKRKLYVIIDNAYQGFATGDLKRDATAFRTFADAKINLVLTTSYAKNFGLYGERVGANTMLLDSKEEAAKVKSQHLHLIRANHSNPPLHGARIVCEILKDPKLKKIWKGDIKTMSNRLMGVRKLLVQALKKVGSQRNWDFIERQIGMFSYTGLNKEQCRRLKEEHHVYLLESGRLAVTGLTTKNVPYVAEAIHKVTS